MLDGFQSKSGRFTGSSGKFSADSLNLAGLLSYPTRWTGAYGSDEQQVDDSEQRGAHAGGDQEIIGFETALNVE